MVSETLRLLAVLETVSLCRSAFRSPSPDKLLSG